MRILLLENDIRISNLIINFFEEHGHIIIPIQDIKHTLDQIKKRNFDLFVLDLGLESTNGFDTIKSIREIDKISPIIVVNGSLELNTLSKAYDLGCNEYMKKPFYLKELEIKVNILFNKNFTQSVIPFKKDFFYDRKLRQFFHMEKPIYLKPKESKLCEILINNLNGITHSANIIEHVWGNNNTRANYPLRQLVYNTKKQLPYNIIRTITRQGYTMSNKPF